MRKIIYPMITAFSILVVAYFCMVSIDNTKMQNTYDLCCEGYACTDTYYDPKDNLCHMTNCMFWENCSYEAKWVHL